MRYGKKIIYDIFMTIFMVFLLIPGVLMLSKVRVGKSLNEKRAFAEFPEFNKQEGYKDYFKKIDAYFKDQFPFRNMFIYGNSWFLYYVFGVSSNREVVFGKEGLMYFFPGALGESTKDVRRLVLYTEEELEKIKINIEKRKDAVEQKGMKFFLLLIPNKETIYPEFLPNGYPAYYSEGRADQLVEYLKEKSTVEFYYLKNELIEAKENSKPLYFRNDTHWNDYGAYIGYYTFLQQLNKTGLRLFDGIDKNEIYFKFNERNLGGDLSSLIGLGSELVDVNVSYKIKLDDNAKKIEGILEPYNKVFRNKHSSGGSVYFLCDSFTQYGMIKFLPYSFNESYFVWHSMPHDTKKIKNKKFDLFVLSISERFFNYLEMPMADENDPFKL